MGEIILIRESALFDSFFFFFFIETVQLNQELMLPMYTDMPAGGRAKLTSPPILKIT